MKMNKLISPEALFSCLVAGCMLTGIASTLGDDTFQTVYTFGPDDNGSVPSSALIPGPYNILFGITEDGGRGYGNVFMLDEFGYTSLYSFNGTSDGAYPVGGIVADHYGNIYGTTMGGSHGFGTIYQFVPSPFGGELTTLYSFTGPSGDGLGNSMASLAIDSGGNLYGTIFSSATGQPGGAVYKMSTTPGYTGPAVLHWFSGGEDGAAPNSVALQGGNLYGTTLKGGKYGFGTVFRVTPTGSFKTIYQFTGGSDGGAPVGPWTTLAAGRDGNLYGTTYAGGAGNGPLGFGTLFKVTRDGALTTLYRFTGGTDGAYPCGLTLGRDGNFYGMCKGNGDNESIFEVTPAGGFATLHAFTNKTDPAIWQLTQGADGKIYGIRERGEGNEGSIFNFSIPAPPPAPTAPSITLQPKSTSVLAGSTVYLTVNATGTAPLSYQWKHNGISLSDTHEFSGTATSTLTISGAQFSDNGKYLAVVSNAKAATPSSEAVVTVNSPPGVVTGPKDQTVIAGNNAVFKVIADGTPSLKYQWLQNGSPIIGQKSASLTLQKVTFAQSAAYSVVVSNSFGSVTSDTASLLVVTNPFPPVAGVYNGLFMAGTNATDETAGIVQNLVLGPRGIYSGKLWIDGQANSLSRLLKNPENIFE